MVRYLRQNTTTDVPFGPFVEASDGSSYKVTTITMPTTGTQHVRVWKADGTVTGLAGAITLFEPGWARLSIAASDVTSAGVVRYAIGNATNNMPVWREYMVVPANVYDSLILGSDFLQVDVQQVTGSAPSNAAIGSVANLTTGVNVTSINGGAVSYAQIKAQVSDPVNANVLTITGAAVSAAFAGYVIPVNVIQITGAAPSAAIAGYGIHVSSIAAGVGVNVTSINGGAVSNATFAAGSVLDYVMFTPGAAAQTITLKDTFRVMAAVLAGRCTGATGAAMVFHGVSGETRVSSTLASGNRTTVSWVTG